MGHRDNFLTRVSTRGRLSIVSLGGKVLPTVPSRTTPTTPFILLSAWSARISADQVTSPAIQRPHTPIRSSVYLVAERLTDARWASRIFSRPTSLGMSRHRPKHDHLHQYLRLALLTKFGRQLLATHHLTAQHPRSRRATARYEPDPMVPLRSVPRNIATWVSNSTRLGSS
jgi:hypothetical protein